MINLEQWERGVAGLIEVSMEFQGRLQIAAEINFRPVLEECVLDLMADAGFCLRWLEVHPCPDDDLGLLADQLFSSLWLAARSVKRLVRLGHPSPVDLALVDQEIEESRSAAVDALLPATALPSNARGRLRGAPDRHEWGTHSQPPCSRRRGICDRLWPNGGRL